MMCFTRATKTLFFIWSLCSTEDKKQIQRCKSYTLTSPNRRLTQQEISGNQSTVSSWRRVGVMNSGCHRGTEEKRVQIWSKEPRFCSLPAHGCPTRDWTFELSSDSSSINLFFKNEKKIIRWRNRINIFTTVGMKLCDLSKPWRFFGHYLLDGSS